MTQPNPDKVSASGHFYTDDEVREAEVEAHRIDPLADEKKLLDLVVEGLAERRSGLPENPDARPVETVADLDRWGGPASEVLTEIRAERPPMAANDLRAITDEVTTDPKNLATVAERRRAVRAAKRYFPEAGVTGAQLVDRTRKLTDRQAIGVAAGAISALYSDVREAQPYVGDAVRWALRNMDVTQGDREVVSQLAMLLNVSTRIA